ncbi:MAG: hypothetical protein KatS3mg009_3290 [Acidimicrobiia bacterium]|nr:MAG: hypothetical protein KatS3mg009_3290 [Acidimicrobiia bacterium]
MEPRAEPPAGPVLVQWRAHASAGAGDFVDGDVVRFAEPQPRVAPGQVVACYEGDVLLGGGVAAPARA